MPRNGPFVLCTLYGGNDGLNTVIPYESGIYRDWRGGASPSPANKCSLSATTGRAARLPPLPGRAALPLEGGQGRHHQRGRVPQPQLQPLCLSDHLADRPATSADPDAGWLGRWLDATGTDPFRALSIGPTLPPALVGSKQQASSLVDSTSPGAQLPGQNPAFTGAYKQLMSSFPGEPALQAGQANSGGNLMRVGSMAAKALNHEQPPAAPAGSNPGDIGTQLDIVAELISYGLPTSVYSVSWASFDTHSDQANNHAGMLASLDSAVTGFMSAFPKAAPGKSPVIVICSEFGRTPRVNASLGTDHSSASVVLVVGPAVKGGFYGATPSFTKLDPYGNLIFTTDFRRVYATVLERVLGIESVSPILDGGFRPIDFL